MDNKLKNAFKETPERFRYTVKSAIDEAQHTAPSKHHLSKGAKITVAVILILSLIPAAVFGAAKIIGGMNAEKEGNYGVKIITITDPVAEYPKYVQIDVKTPSGFYVDPNTDGMKFSTLSTERPYTDGFTIDAFRPNANGIADIADYAEKYEETNIAGHTAYKIIPVKNHNSWDRIYIYYDDVNVMLLIYYTNVTDDQLTDFIEGITVKEGTAKDHTEIGSYDFDDDNTSAPDNDYEITQEYIEKPLDTEITYADFGEDGSLSDHPSLSCRVSGVRVLDNISELDENGFNDLYTYDEIADENGSILPHTREVWQYGDGITTKDELLSSEEVDRRLVLIDLDYTNLTDEDRPFYIPWRLSAMTKNADGSFKRSESIDADRDIAATEFATSEIYYMSDHGEGKAFYSPTLSANESKTITIGFIADADKLEELYLTCCPSSDSVLSPSYPTENPYTYFLLKVL